MLRIHQVFVSREEDEVVKVGGKQKQAAIPYIPFALLASSSLSLAIRQFNPLPFPLFTLYSHTKHYHLLFSFSSFSILWDYGPGKTSSILFLISSASPLTPQPCFLLFQKRSYKMLRQKRQRQVKVNKFYLKKVSYYFIFRKITKI